MRSLVGGALLVVLGLPASGCASGKITGISAPDPEGPVLHVACVVEGLAHHASLCQIECVTSEYRAEAGVPMDGNIKGPQQVTAKVSNWKRYVDPHRPVGDGVVRVRFLYNRGILHEVVFTEPPFDPEGVERTVTGRTRGPDDAPRSGKPVRPPPDPDALPPGLSRDIETPTRVALTSEGIEVKEPHLVQDGKLVFGVSQASGPQYARIDTEPGRVRLVVDVTSKGRPGENVDPSWWRIDLLDAEGLELPQPVREQGFVEMGDAFRTVLSWSFDGPGQVLKIDSGSKAGDVIKIQFTREEGSWLPR